jgi:hypothetical protein
MSGAAAAFHIDELLRFCFPEESQHPLSTGRLYIFGENGPLHDGKLKSGFKGSRFVLPYELESLCLQCEREDIMMVYLHNPKDMGLLGLGEQEMIIQQADNALKREKGKAMLPRVKREEVIALLESAERNENGLIFFHAAQRLIRAFREKRIKEFKLMYPTIASPSKSAGVLARSQAPRQSTRRTGGGVSSAVAPPSMFQKMKGLSPADLIEQVLTVQCLLALFGFYSLSVSARNYRERTSIIILISKQTPAIDRTTECVTPTEFHPKLFSLLFPLLIYRAPSI